ncbi:unnamed protein product [Cutaneotrichosporon oleaginosum]
MSTSFLPFPSRFFSRKSRSKRTKTAPEPLKQPVVVLSPAPLQPLRPSPPPRSQGYPGSRTPSPSLRSAHTTEYAPQRYPDAYLPRKIPSLNELSRSAPRSQPPQQARHALKAPDGPRYAPRHTAHAAPMHTQQREDAWRGRRFSEQVQQAQPNMPLTRSTSVNGHGCTLEPPWQGGLASSIQEESDSEGEAEGPLGPLEVLEAFFNEEPLPDCIVLPPPTEWDNYVAPAPNGSQAGHTHIDYTQPPPSGSQAGHTNSDFTQPLPPNGSQIGHTSGTVARSPPTGSQLGHANGSYAPPPQHNSQVGHSNGGRAQPPRNGSQIGHTSPSNRLQRRPLSPPAPAQAAALPPPPPPPSSPPPPPPGAPRTTSRSRTPQLLDRPPPTTPPRRPSPSSVEPKPAPVASPPNPGKSSFSMPRLRRNSSRRRESPERPLSPPHGDIVPYGQRPLPPTPPERGDSLRNRLMSRRRRSGEPPQRDGIQEEEVAIAQVVPEAEMEPPLKQLGEALSLSPAPRPLSLGAYIIPPEERAAIGHTRRGSTSSVSSAGDSTYLFPYTNPLHAPQPQPQPMPTSPFRLTFSPPTGLQPPPRPRSSMVSTRSAASSNSHLFPQHSVLKSSALRRSPVLQDDMIAHW